MAWKYNLTDFKCTENKQKLGIANVIIWTWKLYTYINTLYMYVY